MKNRLIVGVLGLVFSSCVLAETQPEVTHRATEFSNDKVNVWKTLLLPGQNQQLQMHHHEHDRVLVALTNGEIKVTNNKGETHHLFIKKDHSYFLPKDQPGLSHTDINMGNKPIEVIVIELKY